jgi:hypothetical protein
VKVHDESTEGLPKWRFADVSIAFRLPSNVDPKAFEAWLRSANPYQWELLLEKTAVESWWLSLLPEGTKFSDGHWFGKREPLY